MFLLKSLSNAKKAISRERVAKYLVLTLTVTLMSFGGPTTYSASATSSSVPGVGVGNGLQMFLRTEAVATNAATSTPFNSNTCFVGNIVNLDFSSFNAYTSCGSLNGANRENITAYIRGYILAPASETISFWSSNDDGLLVSINGTRVISNWVDTGPGAYGTFNTNSVTNTIAMTQGRIYPIEIQYHQTGAGATLKLYWSYPSCPGCSTKATAQLIPQNQLGTSSADLGTDCAIGMSEACPASSAMEIKDLTGTNTDGLYWITSAGVSTQVFSLMNSSLGGGGWQLAMKGQSSSSTFGYSSPYWTDTATLNSGSPSRIATSNSDAKYSTFHGTFANQMMALFPSYSGGDYGGAYPSAGYGFAWSESITGMTPWTAYNGTTGFGGNSASTNMTNGPQGSGGCRTTPSTLRDMFTTSNRCAIRQVAPLWATGTESYPSGAAASYKAAGNNLFATQKDIRFFGINYGMNSTSASTRARWGFGFNENGNGDEGSNDVLGGIGLGGPSITAGTFMGCCSATGGGGQAGVSGNSNGSATNMAFELYVRETGVQISGSTELRTAAGSSASLTLSSSRSSGATSTTWNIPGLLTGLTLNTSTGVLTASASVAAGTYYETATAIDDTGARDTYPIKITITPAASETDTAISLSGQFLAASNESAFDISSGTTFTLEAWVRPSVTNANQILLGKDLQYSLLISSNGSFGANFFTTNTPSGTGGETAIFGAASVRPNEWQHVALVRNGTTITGFINGQQVGSMSNASANDSIRAGSNPFVIGGYSTSNQPYTGHIDQVRVWSSARTSAELQAGMNAFLPATQTNLIASYGFNESVGTRIYNNSTAATWDTDLTLMSGSLNRMQIAETSTSGVYSVITFRRSFLTANGGWKVPTGVTRASAIVVGGGGGGGFGTATNRPAGGGGGGGVTVSLTQAFTPGGTIPIQVGQGGLGGFASDLASVRNGQQSVLGPSGLLTALGGGGGGNAGGSGAGGSTVATGGGSGESSYTCTGSPPQPSGSLAPGATVDTGYNGSGGIWGWGGSGGGARGAAANGTCSGNQAGTPGSGYIDPVTSVEYGRGGNAASFSATNAIAGNTTQNNGWGGIISYNGGNSSGVGYRGSNGIIIIRWITATAPTFTAPAAIDTTTALTRYTFRAGGSATSPLIRNFQWQFSSDTGTTWSTVQASTSDSYTTGLLDLGTSGPRYRYRVIVTDSDIAGLSISDSSTAHLVLNRYPTISPPTSNDTGLLVHLDASQAASYSGSGSTWNDISGGSRNASLGFASGGPAVAGNGSVTCSAPLYSSANGGSFIFDGNITEPRKCAWISNSSFSSIGETYTVEMWVNPASSTQVAYSALISTPWSVNDKIYFAIAFNGTTTTAGVPDIWGGVFDGTNWYQTPITGLPINSWSHVSLTSSNRQLTLYVNGEARQIRSFTAASTLSGTNKGVFIGRRWDGADTINGSVGTVRISNTALTAEQIRQNYYLSSNRFSNSVSGAKASSTTYAVTLTETFTATNGTGTKRFTFTPNNRAGIVWDTSTANSAVLRVTNQLNAGTYFETMTATDSATAATTLALTITVDKARQASLSIGQYNAFVGTSTYPINVYGGSGTGAVTRSRLSAGSANCTLASGMFLTATSPGSCSVQAVRAGDTNYLSETATATIFWIQWSDAYATRVPSTPTEIVLNHSTAITKYNYETLTVTGYQNGSGLSVSSIAKNQILRIVGDGFTDADYIEVLFANMEARAILPAGQPNRFTEMQVITVSGINYLELTVPSGAESGIVTVNSPKGTARGPSLTITP